MGSQQDAEVGDDFRVEVSDLRPDGDAPSAPATRSLVEPKRKPGQRLSQLAITFGVACLALLVILGSIPALREGVVGLDPGRAVTPTPTVQRSADLFYLLPNPPGVDVSLDGQVLTHLPVPGDPHPLRLARGHHVIAWRSHLLPFLLTQCRMSIPSDPGDECPIVTGDNVPPAVRDLPGVVIGLHDSLATMSPADGNQLTVAIQRALDAQRSSAIVQPGERYYYYQTGQAGAAVVARQPLRATLSYLLDTTGGYSEPCFLGGPAIPCRFLGQDCSQLCTVVQRPSSEIAAANEWLAAALVHASWTYTTLDGQVVADQIGEYFGVQIAVLRITWDSAGWHVISSLGHTPGLDAADDLVCDPARVWLGQSASWSFMLNDPPPDAQVQFASDGTPVDGCVAVLTHGRPAIFLERFGVLLTVNDVARNPTDNLPVADATGQRIAAQLLAELQT